MTIRISKSGKSTLTVETPVMNATGILGFGDQYRDLIDLSKLGAFVTNPITYAPWSPATGTRAIPMDSGMLLHTGLPNPGAKKIIAHNREVWAKLGVPVIAHIVAHSPEDMASCVRIVDREEAISAIEIGLADDISPAEVEWFLHAALQRTEKPVLARLAFNSTSEHAKAAIDAGASALVAYAPPRGTARDRRGVLTAGRLYGPMIKPLVLRMVGQLVRALPHLPIIACGGIHSPQDARDFIEAGATAVQVDSAVWISPRVIETIATDLGGTMSTQRHDHGSVDDAGDSEIRSYFLGKAPDKKS